MTVTELEREQAYVDRARSLLDRGLADAEQNIEQHGGLHRSTASAMKRALDILKASRTTGQLVFGRIDDVDGPLYIGRRRVRDEQHNPVVVGWHAPAARVYYEATPQDPRGLLLKRVFVEEDRRLLRLIDEIVACGVAQAAGLPPAPGEDAEGGAGPLPVPASGETSTGPVIADALLAELERSRDGAMRDVVATIQAEQYRIIRAERDGVLVVQGGPGTGKTVVGLHRAAYLAFNDAALRRAGILVVAPSSPLLSYIAGVLPSLDASDVHQTDLASLYAGEARAVGEDEPETARVKGSAAMATLLAKALAARTGWPGGDLELSLGSVRVSVPEQDIRDALAQVRRRSVPHNEGREMLRQVLSGRAYRIYADGQREARRPVVANESAVRRLSAFGNALDRLWPTFTPEDFLRSLYGTQAWLVDAADGVLTADERARLFRSPRAALAEEPWTAEDLFCLDELSATLNGETVGYGHIVVDEAQDLSPMQARALARRCPTSSFTVLGDLAQATGVWVRDGWDELTEHFGSAAGSRVETLSIGYRVPEPVLGLAALQLPLISPGLRAPRSLRPGRVVPAAVRAEPDGLMTRALAVAADAVEASLTTAVVVADTRFDDAWRQCAALGVDVGDGRDGDFSKDVTLLPAGATKGLEFDAVVLVAPDEVVATGTQGRRTLYVAMTRCTQELHIVHSDVLPTGLDHLAVPPPALPSPRAHGDGGSPEVREPSTDTGSALEQLVALLDAGDRALVESLVRRLLADAAAHDPQETGAAAAAARGI